MTRHLQTVKKFVLNAFAAFITLTMFSCSSVKDNPSEITYATFNIRLDHSGDSLNNWKYRKDTVASFIHAQDLDIIGMQEVLHNQLEEKANMPLYSSKKTDLRYWTIIHSGCHNILTV